MNEVRRARVQCEIDQIAAMRERIRRIRDDEDRAIRGEALFGDGCQAATDALADAGHVLLVALDKLGKVKQCKN